MQKMVKIWARGNKHRNSKVFLQFYVKSFPKGKHAKAAPKVLRHSIVVFLPLLYHRQSRIRWGRRNPALSSSPDWCSLRGIITRALLALSDWLHRILASAQLRLTLAVLTLADKKKKKLRTTIKRSIAGGRKTTTPWITAVPSSRRIKWFAILPRLSHVRIQRGCPREKQQTTVYVSRYCAASSVGWKVRHVGNIRRHGLLFTRGFNNWVVSFCSGLVDVNAAAVGAVTLLNSTSSHVVAFFFVFLPFCVLFFLAFFGGWCRAK